MTTHMPVLNTERLIIRPFRVDDLDAIHVILDRDLAFTSGNEERHSLAERRAWLEWTVRSERELGNLFQPPYGDRAVTLHDGTLIGAVGFVPELKPFEQITWFRAGGPERQHYQHTPEVGLFWAIGTQWQRHGYATEAARALVRFGFDSLNFARIIASTEYDNVASIGVMRRLGMRIERNPLPDPFYLQVVGVIVHPER
ncbi:MAG TPA: GNAT family N-acetyltransferase [Chloroflexota bacterium]|nr:GNAT family N-acetyltransferase [Chloroflexota bacterium]